MKRPISNEKGFMLFLQLILIPLIVLTYFGFTLTTSVTDEKRKLEHLCENTMLNAQDQQAQLLRRLLSLNAPARALRKQRKLADKALKAAKKTGNPKAYLAAKAFSELIRAKQRSLVAKQNGILDQAPKDWARSHKSLLAQLGPRIAELQFRPPIRLPVLAQGVKTGSPTYHPLPNAEALQRSHFSWVKTLSLRSAGIRQLTDEKKLKISIQCSGTLKKVRSKWVAILNQARS